MILQSTEWPEVLHATITWASGTDNRLRASALNILQSLALYVADHMQEQFANFNGLFQTLLTDSHCPNQASGPLPPACARNAGFVPHARPPCPRTRPRHCLTSQATHPPPPCAHVAGPQVKIEAVRAASAIVVCCDSVQQAAPFRPLIPHMINLIKALLASNDSAGAHKLISCFIDVADTFATWWKPQVADVSGASVSHERAGVSSASHRSCCVQAAS